MGKRGVFQKLSAKPARWKKVSSREIQAQKAGDGGGQRREPKKSIELLEKEEKVLKEGPGRAKTH